MRINSSIAVAAAYHEAPGLHRNTDASFIRRVKFEVAGKPCFIKIGKSLREVPSSYVIDLFERAVTGTPDAQTRKSIISSLKYLRKTGEIRLPIKVVQWLRRRADGCPAPKASA